MSPISGAILLPSAPSCKVYVGFAEVGAFASVFVCDAAPPLTRTDDLLEAAAPGFRTQPHIWYWFGVAKLSAVVVFITQLLALPVINVASLLFLESDNLSSYHKPMPMLAEEDALVPMQPSRLFGFEVVPGFHKTKTELPVELCRNAHVDAALDDVSH
jgi:hypothetical protein